MLTSHLAAGSILKGGQFLTSPGGRYRLVMQTDGNLVLYWLQQLVWATNTAGRSGAGAYAKLQRDGNFVVYDGTNALWSSSSGGHQPADFVLSLLSDGNFVITAPNGTTIKSSRTETAGVRVEPAAAPAWNADGADPFVTRIGATYYAFTTGTKLGNYIQVLESDQPAGPWRPFKTSYGDTALPDPPSWEQPNTQTSPTVISTGGHYVMFYDASERSHPAGTGYDCLSVATATTITPGNPVFTDHSTHPLVCDPGVGVLDPSAYVDATTHAAYLLWKSNDGASTQASHIWSQQLDAAGTAFAAKSQPRIILTNNTGSFPWETTLDDPDLAFANGRYFLMFSVGLWESNSYAEAFATCAAPLGPCRQPAGRPFLSSYGQASGPAGGSLFVDTSGNWWIDYAAWVPGCTRYGTSCNGARRFFVAPIDLGG